MITIQKSPTADDTPKSSITREVLLKSSIKHIVDVGNALAFFSAMLTEAADAHDLDKLTEIDTFHAEFIAKSENKPWWDKHRRIHRHHLSSPDGVPEDVNLVDCLEYVADCVMSGMARKGSVYGVTLPNEVLQKALSNTVALLASNVEVKE
jgi:hypothetical protein